MVRLVIVNGLPRVGKDSMIDICREHLYMNHNIESLSISSIDNVKHFARTMGWNGDKTPEMREMLSELKDLYTKYFDGPFNDITDIVLDNTECVTFSCVRECDEIAKLVAWGESEGIEVVTVLVSGSRGEAFHASHSDLNVLDYNYDVIIDNNGSIELFTEGCEYFTDEKFV